MEDAVNEMMKARKATLENAAIRIREARLACEKAEKILISWAKAPSLFQKYGPHIGHILVAQHQIGAVKTILGI